MSCIQHRKLQHFVCWLFLVFLLFFISIRKSLFYFSTESSWTKRRKKKSLKLLASVDVTFAQYAMTKAISSHMILNFDQKFEFECYFEMAIVVRFDHGTCQYCYSNYNFLLCHFNKFFCFYSSFEMINFMKMIFVAHIFDNHRNIGSACQKKKQWTAPKYKCIVYTAPGKSFLAYFGQRTLRNVLFRIYFERRRNWFFK